MQAAFLLLPPLFGFQGADFPLTIHFNCVSIWHKPFTVGVFSGEGPPVPIPNTEVKLTCADDTCLATGWKNRSTPTQNPEII